ncbi:MAG: hypothetical protein V7608_1237 [Hyphomicrobiales bacterium]
MIIRSCARPVGIVAMLCVAVGALLTLMPSVPAADLRPAWSEVAWRFPIDQWGLGKTFRCRAKDCGHDAELYVRAKIGFCNCTTGVADDEDLERVADFDLFGNRPAALASGHVVKARQMTGRARVYSIATAGAEPKKILTIALNRKCDAVVATVIAGDGDPEDFETAALEFLGSDLIARWLGSTSGS